MHKLAILMALLAIDLPVVQPQVVVPVVVALPHGIPQFGISPTVRSTCAGMWADPTIWSTGQVPGPDDVVLIQHQVEHCADCGPQVVRVIRLEGTLLSAGELWFQTLLCMPGSSVEISPGAELVVRDMPFDPIDLQQWGNGVICLGDWKSNVTTFVEPYSETIGDVRAGAVVVTLKTDMHNWSVGDEIILPHTNQTSFRTDERRNIQSINGATLFLNQPAAFAHPACAQSGNGVPIVNLSRPIVIRSENPDGIRGHVAFTGPAMADVCGIEFRDLGRTKMTGFGNLPNAMSQIGRYSVHWHHAHMPDQCLCYCSVNNDQIDRDLRWLASFHNTHRSEIYSNAFWGRCQDGCFVTEDGPETDLTVMGNVAGGGRHGFWFYGFNGLSAAGNVAVSCLSDLDTNSDKNNTGTGYVIGWGDNRTNRPSFPRTVVIPNSDGSTTIRNYRDLSMGYFGRNASIGCEVGAREWTIGMRASPYGSPDAPEIVFDDHLCWHCRVGLFPYYGGRVVLRRPRIYGQQGYAQSSLDRAGQAYGDKSEGIRIGTRANESVLIENADIRGMGIGLYLRLSGKTINVVDINGGTLENDVDIRREIWSEKAGAVTRLDNVTCLGKTQIEAFGVSQAVDQFGSIGALDECFVSAWQGVAGDDFELLQEEQSPDLLFKGSKFPVTWRGLRAGTVFQRDGKAIAGKLLPSTARRRPGIRGWVSP